MQWWSSVFSKYGDLTGRASRSEFVIFNFFSSFFLFALNKVSAILAEATGISAFYFLGVIAGVILFIPALAIVVRRLHDLGKGIEFILVLVVPVVNFLAVLYLIFTPGQPGTNAYGPPPSLRLTQKDYQG